MEEENDSKFSHGQNALHFKSAWHDWEGMWGVGVSCIFTTLGYWNKWEPAKKHETKFRIGVIIEGFLGWIIMALFVISLTMTWIR